MAKLTKAQKRAITSALAAIERTQRYINSPQVAVCHVSRINAKVPQLGGAFRSGQIVESKAYEHRDPTQPGWTIDFVEELSPMTKGVGSDLVALYDAKRLLETLLAE